MIANVTALPLDAAAHVVPGIALVTLTAAWILAGRLRARGVLQPLISIFIIRILLFDNAFAWRWYYQALDPPHDIEFHQHRMIEHQAKRFLKTPASIINLTVGSSQATPIFSARARTTETLSIFIAPGFASLDGLFYSRLIFRYRPEKIFLFLSEFDLARVRELSALKIAPTPDLETIALLPEIKKSIRNQQNALAFTELVVGVILPEYKYGYIFKGLIKKALGMPRSVAAPLTEAELEEQLQKKIDFLLRTHDESPIETNVRYLRLFLERCRRQGIRVMIIEGQYNPLAYTDKMLRLNRIVRGHLEAVAREIEGVRFIPREETVLFTPEDYEDATHVRPGPRVDEFVDRVLWLATGW